MRTITLEEHFVTESFLKATGAYGINAPPQLAQMQPKLLDLGAGRIAAMDEAAIDLQVMSLAVVGIDKLEPAAAVDHRPHGRGSAVRSGAIERDPLRAGTTEAEGRGLL